MTSQHDRYFPSALATVRVERDGTRWTLVFTRELAHSPARVWKALTDPRELSAWAPFDAERDLGTPGETTLSMAGTDGSGEYDRLRAEVRVADTARLLEYTWGDDVLRWELSPTAKGTRLTLSHTLDERSWVPKTAAGWHICLDVAEAFLAGTPLGRIVGDTARERGWRPLNAQYAMLLGIPNDDA